ncbi:MAG TPA: PaaI family thioesterase [Devosiaceae bacterium]
MSGVTSPKDRRLPPGERRSRTVSWHDPAALNQMARAASGHDFIAAVAEGTVGLPPVCEVLGMEFVEAGKGEVAMRFAPDEIHFNAIGSVHGGVIATLLDTVMGCAVQTTLPAGRAYTTLEIKVNYIRAVSLRDDHLEATGRVIHSGRTTAVAEGTLKGQGGRVYAHATTTCLIFDAPRDNGTQEE